MITVGRDGYVRDGQTIIGKIEKTPHGWWNSFVARAWCPMSMRQVGFAMRTRREALAEVKIEREI